MTTLEAVGGSFDFGRVVGRTFRVIGDNLGVFAIAALILVTLPVFAGTIIGITSGSATVFSLASGGGGLIAGVGGLILQGLVVHAAINRLNGRSVETGEIVNVGARYALPLLGLAIISTLGLMLGFVLLLVPGLILCVVWSVASPSLVMEKRGVFDSLQRSRDLTRGHRWSIFGLLVVYSILSIVISLTVQGLSGAAGVTTSLASSLQGEHSPITATVVLATLLSALTSGVQGIVGAAGAASIYYELRTTKEGVAPDQLASVFD